MSIVTEKDLPQSPFKLLQEWTDLAKSSSKIEIPDACHLTTIDQEGFPDGRIVLAREIDETGIIFYTNSNSVKGAQLKQNPKAAITYYWEPLGKQIRVQGVTEPVSSEKSDEYFKSRPRLSQVGAWASAQSEPLASREALESAVKDYDAKYPGEVPRPPHWIGYKLIPHKIEFWIDREYRLHDRFIYKKIDQIWHVQRVAP